MLNKIKGTLTILSTIALFSSIIILTACSRTIGTKPCEISANKLPPIRGIRLGMTMQELENSFPNLIRGELFLGKYRDGKYDSWNDREDGSIQINFSSYKFPEQLEGVSNVTVEIFEEKVYKFVINYDFKFVPNDHDKFIKQVSESLNMPDALWKFKEDRYAILTCANNTDIRVIGYSVEGIDRQILSKILDSKFQKDKKQGQDFRP